MSTIIDSWTYTFYEHAGDLVVELIRYGRDLLSNVGKNGSSLEFPVF